MVDQKRIEWFGNAIGRQFSAEQVILFGSYANGEVSEDSDVDLLVIVKHMGKSWQMASAIRQAVHPPFPVDLLVRTPEQVEQRLKLGDPFIGHILKEGKVLYEANH